ncbi:hydantoinase/oxoprolinase family protein [Bosea sp. BIWAKO-01]|uniref:hydantoinase/oxoprolinase family protein n=1 Tax=Bosea sp. BIWAKO-01 TaxID=506668 RepID=UPI0008530BC6|nr:hydantoinase/oxoprolinase family protein [Bosea sp. BIWAKO-01]GAU86995.1 N-methylhydantoinase A [Bosea sp. BIWAKO-01]
MALQDAAPASSLSVAVDIGGTFTDLVGFDETTGRVLQSKSLTTPHELSQGVWDCLAKAGIEPRAAQNLVHGSTVAINIAIEQKGAKTALVVTKGTRDVYKIGRQNRPDAYDFNFKRPSPLTPRSLTFEVSERLKASGEVLSPLDQREVEDVAAKIRDSGVAAVAVCFLHAYANPAHEIEAGRLLRAALPGVYVSLSHEIVREYREYERTSTTVMNAYIGPRSAEYVGRMQDRLGEDGFDGRFLIMQSSGGVMSPEHAKVLPVAMMESGPVGGVIAAAEIGRRLGLPNVITFDMGGTTAKTSLIQNSVVSIAQGYHVGGHASGHPVMFPVVDIVEVGAGGGSIAWIDDVGGLKLGPRSAGSDPGPVCYRRGGAEPTVTDANVVLGRIGARSFLGGEMPLDEAAARAALTEKIGGPLGLEAAAAAHGVIRVAIAKMALAVRGVSVQRGYDPRDFALVAMGGGGPPHALEIARDLAIPKVIVPNLPAHFSALGMLMSDVRHDFVRTHYRILTDADTAEIRTLYEELADAGAVALDQAGVEPAVRSVEYFMDLRYAGQEFTLQIPVNADEIAHGAMAAVRSRFDDTHQNRFDHSAPDEQVELVNLRLTARGARPKIMFPRLAAGDGDARIGVRPIVLDDPAKPIDCPVYRRERLTAGARIEGPCAIEEFGSTTLLFAGDVATVVETGEMIVEVARP